MNESGERVRKNGKRSGHSAVLANGQVCGIIILIFDLFYGYRCNCVCVCHVLVIVL